MLVRIRNMLSRLSQDAQKAHEWSTAKELLELTTKLDRRIDAIERF